MSFIKKGITRCVFLIGPIVIKFPKFGLGSLSQGHINFLKGCVANWNERLVYRYTKSLLLAPTLWCSWFGLIQIQKRVKLLDRELTKAEKKTMQKFCSDIKSSNFGIYKGRLVCIDYGD